MGKRAIVAGHSCLDMTPVFPKRTGSGENISVIMTPGTLIQMDGMDIHAGGTVSNTGLAMKMLGIDVTLRAKIGDDFLGTILSDIYGKYDADKGVIIDKGGHTSYSVVVAPPGIDRMFLHDPGCNNTFSFDDIKDIDLKDVVLFHFGYPPLMRKMYENDGEELLKIMKFMKENGISTSLDMAFVDERSEAGRTDWNKILTRVLPYVDMFVPSMEELCCMIDHDRYDEWKIRAQGNDMSGIIRPDRDIEPLADMCLKKGAGVVLVKCGAPGFFYKTAGGDRISTFGRSLEIDTEDWNNRKGFINSYVPDRVLSGTGAGDTTIAAFLAAVIKGYSLSESLELAAAEGASCVSAYDALSGLLSLEELSARISSGWKKQAFS